MINPFTVKFSQKQISTNFPNFVLKNFEKQITPCVKVKAESFHFNGHIIGFCRQTKKLESPYKTPSTLAVKGLMGNRTSCRPIWSVIILVIKQIGLRQFCYNHSYDHSSNWLHSVLLPLLTRSYDTCLIWIPCYYGQFSNKLIWTPDADKGHYFLAQLSDSHWKSTIVMWTLHNQLCIVINVSFLKVKKPSVDSMSIFPVLQYTGLWWLLTSCNFRLFWQQTSQAKNSFCTCTCRWAID